MELISTEFLSALAAIIVIDLVLAGDNAIVIALAARGLPAHLRKPAIIWGTVAAIRLGGGYIPFATLVPPDEAHRIVRWLATHCANGRPAGRYTLGRASRYPRPKGTALPPGGKSPASRGRDCRVAWVGTRRSNDPIRARCRHRPEPSDAGAH